MPLTASNRRSSTVQQLVLETTTAHPDQPLLIDPETTFTYRAGADRATRLATGLRALGVDHGNLALLMLDNHGDYGLLVLGMHMYGQVEVPINTAYKGAPLAHVINDSGARVMIVEDKYVPRLLEILPLLDTLVTVVVRGEHSAAGGTRLATYRFDELAGTAPDPLPEVSPWDVLGVLYTSGTTGRAKGVVVSHAHALGCYDPAHWSSRPVRETVLVTLPFFHLGGQWGGLLYAMLTGGTAVIEPRFSASAFWDQVRRFGCTQTLLVGSMATFLFRQPARADDGQHSLRRVIMVPTIDELEAFEERFAVQVGTAYGLTEGSTPIVARYGASTAGQCGTVRSGFDVRLVDSHDHEVTTGEPGEAVLRADTPWTTMLRYHGQPDATAAAFQNLWLHTGDVLIRNNDGSFSFFDRAKDAIRRRGENVSSYEVELAINQHPDVLESAVVAVPSPDGEDAIKAVVACRPGRALSHTELSTYLSGVLPYFMVPRYVDFAETLPKTPTEKIQKAALRADGLTPTTWDREAAGLKISRDG